MQFTPSVDRRLFEFPQLPGRLLEKRLGIVKMEFMVNSQYKVMGCYLELEKCVKIF